MKLSKAEQDLLTAASGGHIDFSKIDELPSYDGLDRLANEKFTPRVDENGGIHLDLKDGENADDVHDNMKDLGFTK